MNQSHQERYQQETDEILAELERVVALPRTRVTELKIKRLMKRAGWPETAKTMFKRKHRGKP